MRCWHSGAGFASGGRDKLIRKCDGQQRLPREESRDEICSPQFGFAIGHAATRASVETESIDSTQVSDVISS